MLDNLRIAIALVAAATAALATSTPTVRQCLRDYFAAAFTAMAEDSLSSLPFVKDHPGDRLG